MGDTITNFDSVFIPPASFFIYPLKGVFLIRREAYDFLTWSNSGGCRSCLQLTAPAPTDGLVYVLDGGPTIAHTHQTARAQTVGLVYAHRGRFTQESRTVAPHIWLPIARPPATRYARHVHTVEFRTAPATTLAPNPVFGVLLTIPKKTTAHALKRERLRGGKNTTFHHLRYQGTTLHLSGIPYSLPNVL